MFEPICELHCWRVDRPVRREADTDKKERELMSDERIRRDVRQVRHVIIVHRVVQAQSLIPEPPVIPDAFILLDDERLEAKCLQASSNAQSTLSGTNDEHGGLLFVSNTLDLALASTLPEAMVWLGVTTRSSEFWEIVQALEVGVDSLGLPVFPISETSSVLHTDWYDPGNPRAYSTDSLEGEEELNPDQVRRNLSEMGRQGGFGIRELNFEAPELRLVVSINEAIDSELADGVMANEGSEVPRQREHVAPPDLCTSTLGDEEVQEGIGVGYGCVE